MVERLAAVFEIHPRGLLDDADDDTLDMADLRYLQGLRQAQVAAALGIPPVTYQRIEARRAQIDAQYLPDLARILGTTTEVLARKARRPDQRLSGWVHISSGRPRTG